MTATRLGEWRNADRYLSIQTGGRPALAWELLRRDFDYCRSFAAEQIQGRVVAAMPEYLARWDLHFRM
jgi:hypothetical protein